MKGKRREIYQKLVDLYGEKCYICGRSDIPSHIDHLIPQSAGGTSDLTNLRLICPADNARKSNNFFREFEFVQYLFELISKNENFKETKPEVFPNL